MYFILLVIVVVIVSLLLLHVPPFSPPLKPGSLAASIEFPLEILLANSYFFGDGEGVVWGVPSFAGGFFWGMVIVGGLVFVEMNKVGFSS